jgi:hypothetical protein
VKVNVLLSPGAIVVVPKAPRETSALVSAVTSPEGLTILSFVLGLLSATWAVPMFATTTSTTASGGEPVPLYAIGWSLTASTGVGACPANSVKYAITAAPIANSIRVTSIASTGPLRSPLLV